MSRYELQGVELTMDPEGAVYLEKARTLLVADLHLGKAAAFRSAGMPVPDGDVERDLGRLEKLCGCYGPCEVVVAGDLFHSADGMSDEIRRGMVDFLARVRVPFTLVSGNHDRKIDRIPEGVRVTESGVFGEVRVVHDPEDAPRDGALVIAGHWHPVVRLRGAGRTTLRVPSFLLRGRVLVLPSFGGFTGGRMIDAAKGDRFFAGMRNEVVELPLALMSGR